MGSEIKTGSAMRSVAESRTQFAFLADIRIREASALVSSRFALGAIYLAGYAVECALKSHIAERSQNRLPEHAKTHDISELRKIAGRALSDEQYSKVGELPPWSHLLRYECKAPDIRTAIQFVNLAKEVMLCLRT